MPPPIDVFFEFASPYSYLAAQRLPEIAARRGRALRWRPVEMAKVWEAQGVLEAYMAVRRVKVRYIMQDAAMVAADAGVPLVRSKGLPNSGLARLTVHRLNRTFPDLAQPFILATWRKLFGAGGEIGDLAALCQGLEQPLPDEIAAAADDAEAAIELDRANRDAVAAGCFGVPWIVADGVAYFGQDRLHFLDRQLDREAAR